MTPQKGKPTVQAPVGVPKPRLHRSSLRERRVERPDPDQTEQFLRNEPFACASSLMESVAMRRNGGAPRR
jgi:hypothetical protein